jgi:hypothetical protein
VVETNEGIVQFSLDPMPKQPITCGKGDGVNVHTKSLTMYLSEMTFCNYPQLLLIVSEHQTQVESMGEKHTQASHQELLFEELLILKPHADNTDQQEVSYTLIAFAVFSESHRQGHYKAYCKKGDTEWYQFNDEKITKKSADFAKFTTKDNIFTQVTSLYYLKNEEATMKKYAEKAQEKLNQEVDHGYDVGTDDSELSFVKNLAQIQKRGGEESKTEIIAEEEENMMSPNAPTKAPIEPTTASGTINGAYISYSTQHNNIHRSHQIAFPEEEGGLMTQEKHMSTNSTMTMTMTTPGTGNGVYISSPIQHNNILRSHQLFFTSTDDEPLYHNDEEMYEVLTSLSNSHVPPDFIEQMIYPASRFTFVTRQLR